MDNFEKENRIAEALNLRGMKQVELCEKAQVKKSSLNHWIKQHWQPKQKSLMSMARALDVAELWLAGYDVPMERPVEQKKMDELAQLVHALRKDEEMAKLCINIVKLEECKRKIIINMVDALLKN